ncbi:MAG TPA: GTP cyclohydrolase II [Woeseiaceae bacterium]|nr:GTP cyclohydrolase II [Woeseiaceae bacterium]
MFTYLDPDVRRRLIEQGKLRRIDASGREVSQERPPAPGEKAISLLGPIPLPLVQNGRQFAVQWFAAVRHTELTKVQELADELRERDGAQSFALLASSMAVNSVLVLGDPERWTSPLVRVHSSCLTGDVFGSARCECGPQFLAALERIAAEPEGGMLVYMAGHEGRGIGLWAKAATYVLQDAGENTYQANRSLGLPDDSRDFSDAAALIRFFLRDRPFRLLTNNPKKVADLLNFGVRDITPVKHVTGVSPANREYLRAKREWGHEIDEDDLVCRR